MVKKFRAFDVKKKEYIEIGFHIIGEVTVFDVINQYSVEAFNDILIEQFTGLVDRNDTDIYEGDIIIGSTLTVSSEILWNQKNAAWSIGEDWPICNYYIEDSAFDGVDCFQRDVIVIGNVNNQSHKLNRKIVTTFGII